jgi:hypothetical protein
MEKRGGKGEMRSRGLGGEREEGKGYKKRVSDPYIILSTCNLKI